MPFIVNGERVSLHGTLVLDCGDNPAANLMSGYKCLSSAYRKCRTCMALHLIFKQRYSAGYAIAEMYVSMHDSTAIFLSISFAVS